VSQRRTIRLLHDGYPEPPEMDTAVSHATLRRVAEGLEPESLRLHRPAAMVAFGPRDHVAPGFSRAVAAAREHGFASIERLAGGRAAVFHPGTIAFSWAIPDASARERIRERFQETAEIMVEAFSSLGVDARVGEVPGEYCPGEHSVNARGRTKLMGVGQRIVKDAVHVGGVVVVSGGDRIREVLVPVYDALGLDWDPGTTGSLEDEVPGLTWDQAETAVEKAFAARFDLEEGSVTDGTVDRARELASRHAVT
jgi:octanoyl-[GcvH]:protein N-octanoyltransferase